MNSSLKPVMKRRSRILVTLVALLASLLAIVASANVASATVSHPAAVANVNVAPPFGFTHGHWVGNEYVGSIMNNGHLAYCTEPGLRLTQSQSWTLVQSLTGVSALRSQEIAYVLFRHGSTVNDDEAAAVRIAVNAFIGNSDAVTRWERGLNPRVTVFANSFIREAALLHGPFNLRLAILKAAHVGNTGTLQVSVTSAARNPIVGAIVTLNASNATLPRVVRTNSAGTVVVPFTRTGIDVPVITAQTKLAPTAILVGNAAPGQQKLKAAGPAATFNARVTYLDTLVKPAITYNCTTECFGNPPVTSSACNPAAATAVYVMTVDSKVVSGLTLTSGQCGSSTVNVADSKTLVTQLHYVVNGKPTRAITVSTIVIDCPPLPLISIANVCNCTTATFDFALPLNTTRHMEAIYINGSSVATAAPGQTARYHLVVTRGKATSIAFAPAIQRANGAWNVGNPLTINVP